MNLLKWVSIHLTTLFVSMATHGTLAADELYDQDYLHNPSSGYSDGGGCIKIYGDFIYWKAVQDQAHYAAVLTPGELGPTEFSQNISIINPSYKYKPGFRIGACYDLPCSNWNIDLSWVRLHQKTSSSVTQEGGVFPLAIPAASIFALDPTLFGFINQANNSWRFHFDVIDLVFRRNCCFCDLAFSPYVGVKAACISQKQTSGYVGLEIGDFPIVLESNKKNKFRGIGPSFGFDASWEFWNSFSLSGGLEFALLYGKFNVRQGPSITILDITASTNLRSNKKYRIRPAVDANISLDWSTCIWDKFLVQLGVGYEVQYWWNQWQALGSIPSLISGGSSPQGDLMMHGLTARLGVLF